MRRWWMVGWVVWAACSEPPYSGPAPLEALGGAAPFECGDVTPIEGTPRLALEEVASGLDFPVAAVFAPGDDRMYVVEVYAAKIRIVGEETPFLDLSAKVLAGNERGLLGLAFHPEYAANGRLYVNYTDLSGDTVIEEYTGGDPASARTVFTADQPWHNHNGGHVLFGPDGLLYVGLGDGGGQDDEFGNGQTADTPLGNMLRIDVDGAAAPETWAIGLRNPWRYSFDAMTGELYIADVGQARYEEVNVLPTEPGGHNLGWPCREGLHGYVSDPTRCPDPHADFVDPVFEYDREGTNGSITGGFVYRGCRMPALRGTYFFADFTSSWTGSFVLADGQARGFQRWDDARGAGDLGVLSPSSFGEDHQGELYIVSIGAGPGTGAVYRIVPQP